LPSCHLICTVPFEPRFFVLNNDFIQSKGDLFGRQMEDYNKSAWMCKIYLSSSLLRVGVRSVSGLAVADGVREGNGAGVKVGNVGGDVLVGATVGITVAAEVGKGAAVVTTVGKGVAGVEPGVFEDDGWEPVAAVAVAVVMGNRVFDGVGVGVAANVGVIPSAAAVTGFVGVLSADKMGARPRPSG
jgi:hypothetical protein